MKRVLSLATHRLHTMPVLVLMPHGGCNCRCVMCDIWKTKASGEEISQDTLARQIESLRRLNVRWVILSGGEALLHGGLWQLCELLRALSVRITLLSTGLLLERHADDVIRWCDEVIVSLDGSRTVHETIRGVPDAFDRLAASVTALKTRAPGLRVTARCVVQRRNYFDLPRIVEAAHALGLDQISLLPVDVASTAFNRRFAWDQQRVADVALSNDEIAEFRRIVEQIIVRCGADFDSGFIAESPARLRLFTSYFAAISGDGDFPPLACNAPWVSAVVEADGSVRPCFFHRPLGNVHSQSLEVILNSAAAIAFRSTLDVARDPICRRCVCTLHLPPWRSVDNNRQSACRRGLPDRGRTGS